MLALGPRTPLRLLLCVTAMHATSLAQQTPLHFIHGEWFDGTRFAAVDIYVKDGVLTHHPRHGQGAMEIDLHGRFVVPPYGDAHEHNFDGVRGTATVGAHYMRDGIFYAQGMTDTTAGAAEVLAAHLVDTPTTPDVTYAHGGLTGVNGHPKEVYESLALGFFYPATTAEQPRLGEGIDPVLVPLIVQRAHAAGLKVAAHINDSKDFHVAVTAGVDEMAHLPGYGLTATSNAALETLTDADIALAAAHHVKAQATAGLATDESTPAADAAVRRRVQRDNLGRLKKAGVPILVGSDRYSQDSVHEADCLQALGVWSNAEMLRMWAVTTPQAIFPKRKIGCLEEGCEASFLVLAGDPTQDWKAVHGIVDQWKGGQRVELIATAK